MSIRQKIFISSCMLSVLTGMALSFMQFIADLQMTSALRMIDDPTTEYRDAIAITHETLPVYEKFLTKLNRAVVIYPISPVYKFAAADAHRKIGLWLNTLSLLSDEEPNAFREGTNHLYKAFKYYRQAIAIEPTNADTHIALGTLAAWEGDMTTASEELERATMAYPINSAVRYAVAAQFLVADMPEQAVAHARALAKNDDSYMIMNMDQKKFIVENNRPRYEYMLTASYLFKSFEILWRASGKSVKMIQEAIPDNEEARDAAELFFAKKGIYFEIQNKGTHDQSH